MTEELQTQVDLLLLDAAIDGNIEMCRFLIVSGADVNAFDDAGKTPLHWAAEYEDTDMCRTLVDLGADTDALDKAGHTPLDYIPDTRDYYELRAVLGDISNLKFVCPKCGSEHLEVRRRFGEVTSQVEGIYMHGNSLHVEIEEPSLVDAEMLEEVWQCGGCGLVIDSQTVGAFKPYYNPDGA